MQKNRHVNRTNNDDTQNNLTFIEIRTKAMLEKAREYYTRMWNAQDEKQSVLESQAKMNSI